MAVDKKNSSQTFGQQGENLAVEYLVQEGFSIEARNRRFCRAEIDIIARKEDLLLFVEVKIRQNDAFGYPETFLTSVQQENYHQAATAYIGEIAWTGPIRFDIIAIHRHGGQFCLRHFQDAF